MPNDKPVKAIIIRGNNSQQRSTMKQEHVQLLQIIQACQPDITFPDLCSKARHQGLLIDHSAIDDETRVSKDAYRKKLDRELKKIEGISNINIALRRLEGKPVRFAIPSDFTIPASEIDITLAMILNLSKQVLTNVLPEIQRNQLNDYYARADEVLSEDKKSKAYRNFISLVAWHPEGYGSRLKTRPSQIQNNGEMSSLTDAIFRQKKIKMTYMKRLGDANTIERTVSPLGFVLRGNILYVVCWEDEKKHTGNAYRHFKMDRFESVEVLEDTAVIPKDFGLRSYLDEGAFERSGMEPLKDETVELRIFKKSDYIYFMERIEFLDSKSNDMGEFIVTFTQQIYQEFEQWLLEYGPRIEVLKPLSLRTSIALKAAKMHEIYNNDS